MGKDAKMIRGQVRQVVQEVLGEELKKAYSLEIQKQLSEQLDARIKGINDYCTEKLAGMDKRAKDVQGFLMREVKSGMHHTLSDMDVTIQSVVEILAESGIVVENFAEKVASRKPGIITRRREAAEAAMKAQLEAQQAAADAAPPAEAPVGATLP